MTVLLDQYRIGQIVIEWLSRITRLTVHLSAFFATRELIPARCVTHLVSRGRHVPDRPWHALGRIRHMADGVSRAPCGRTGMAVESLQNVRFDCHSTCSIEARC